jgi:hypothetical protein
VLDDETSATNGAQQPEQPKTETAAQGFIKQQEGSPTEQAPGNEEQRSHNSPKPILPVRLWRWLRNWWTNPFRPRGNFPEHMTVVVSIFIAGIAFLQWGVYRQQKKIMESSGHQTQQLIDAANIQACAAQKIADASLRNATAAEKFSGSADKISEETTRAVGELKRAANGSETAMRENSRNAQSALNTSIEASRLDQRAWFGIYDFEILQFDPNDQTKPLRFQIVFMNTGKTPARQINAQGLFQMYAAKFEGPSEADWNAFLGYFTAAKERYSAAPNAKRKMIVDVSATPLTNNFIINNYTAIKNRTGFLYYFGQATYADIDNRPHTTKFCLFLADLDTKQLAYCGKGNDMD